MAIARYISEPWHAIAAAAIRLAVDGLKVKPGIDPGELVSGQRGDGAGPVSRPIERRVMNDDHLTVAR